MSAINRQSNKKSDKNSTFIIAGVIALGAGLLFAYLMFYTAPEESMELVKIIAVTDEGCIAETFDGFAVNIGDCNVQPGQYVDALVDQKTKDRAAAMNPTSWFGSKVMEKSRRVTVMVDDNLLKKLRIIQAAKIRKSENSVSLSQVITHMLEKGLK